MEKQRLFKMTDIEKNMLVRALSDKQRRVSSDRCSEVRALVEKTEQAPQNRLYMNEIEYQWIEIALNDLRNAYLAAGRSSGGIDMVLLKLFRSRYKRVPAR